MFFFTNIYKENGLNLSMKGVFVIVDGMGDLPNKQLKDKTPLEAAKTPNLDFFASRGQMGYLYSVKPGFVPESDEAIVSIFGNEHTASSRGQLEARGIEGMKLTRGDLALRVNFATVGDISKGEILDRRAGRTLTTAESESLAKALNKIELSCKFVFESSVQHRGVLVLRGGFSENLLSNDLTYVKGKLKEHRLSNIKPTDDDENSQYTANVLNEFLEKAHNILDVHPVNLARKKRGLLPANYLLVRGAGIENPKLKQYRKWFSTSYMPLEIGFCKTSGMEIFGFEYPKLKKLDAYENLYDGLKKACNHSVKMIKKHHKKFDYVYVHIKETDLPGHDNKPLEKKAMLEYLDKNLFNFLRKFAPPREIKVVVTADHSTPCKLKAHSADPVPVLYYPAEECIPRESHFNEREARKGKLGKMIGGELLKKVGFVK